MNNAVDNLQQQNPLKKPIPAFDVKHFDYTVNMPKQPEPQEKKESLDDEREDDLDFDEGVASSLKKEENFAEGPIYEEDLAYLKDKKKLEVFFYFFKKRIFLRVSWRH